MHSGEKFEALQQDIENNCAMGTRLLLVSGAVYWIWIPPLNAGLVYVMAPISSQAIFEQFYLRHQQFQFNREFSTNHLHEINRYLARNRMPVPKVQRQRKCENYLIFISWPGTSGASWCRRRRPSGSRSSQRGSPCRTASSGSRPSWKISMSTTTKLQE